MKRMLLIFALLMSQISGIFAGSYTIQNKSGKTIWIWVIFNINYHKNTFSALDDKANPWNDLPFTRSVYPSYSHIVNDRVLEAYANLPGNYNFYITNVPTVDTLLSVTKDILAQSTPVYIPKEKGVVVISTLEDGKFFAFEKSIVDFLLDAAKKNIQPQALIRALAVTPVHVNYKDEEGKTALMHAAISNNNLLLRHLFGAKEPVKIDEKDKFGRTALMYAAQNNSIPVMNAITGRGDFKVPGTADLNVQDNNGQTALMLAAQAGSAQAVNALIGWQAKLDIQDKNGNSALMLAVQNNKDLAASSLINTKTGLNLQDKLGRTALYIATQNKNLPLVEKLVAAGADPNIADNNGYTPLMIAAGYGASDLVGSLLKAKNINVDAQNKFEKNTAFIFAVVSGDLKSVQKLVEGNAKVNLANALGQTPLFVNSHYYQTTKKQNYIDIGNFLTTNTNAKMQSE